MKSGMLGVSLAAIVWMGATDALAAPSVAAVPTISVDAGKTLGPVSPLIFGANHRWVADAAGSADPRTGLSYPNFVAKVREVGITMIRYPAGTLGNLFHFEQAIGPQGQRGQQASGMLRMPMPFDSTFGPDEYGNLLDRTQATGTLVVNFGTGTAAEAADFVAYMTAPSGAAPVNGVDWAAKRGRNGHPAPYNISYAEVGNEWDPAIQPLADENYWIVGEPVQIRASCAETKISCLYAFGGSTRFTKQLLVRGPDWRASTAVSTGEPSQAPQMRYAPVVPGSETVFVGDEQWRAVPDLAAAAPGDAVYQIDDRTGTVRFGDGVHGETPPKGAVIAATYTSGPHEGFVDFYSAIKAANPAIKVCSSVYEENFLRIMGSDYSYDCIQQHPYVISRPQPDGGDGTLDDFFIRTAVRTDKLGEEVARTQSLIKQYGGARNGNATMLLSEYGQLGIFPPFAKHFGRSEGQGVLNALAIREWILHGVTAAGRTVLTDYTFGPIPPSLAAVQASNAETAGDFALLGGPGPDPVLTPPAIVMKLLKHDIGDTLVASSVSDSPRLTASDGGEIDALKTFATTDARGDVCIVVINVSPSEDLTAKVAIGAQPRSRAYRTSLVGAESLNAENSPADRSNVDIVEGARGQTNGDMLLTFPKHSVTAIQVSGGEGPG
jgi:alpha-N-arabinofuranosidase